MANQSKSPDLDDPGGSLKPQPAAHRLSGAAYGNGNSASSIPHPPSYSKHRLPEELSRLPQWVLFRLIWNPQKQKHDKIPINARTGRNASSTDPNTWSDYETAIRAVGRWKTHGIGFVLTDGDPIVCVDLDDCVDDAGAIHPEAQRNIAELDSWSEYSQSGHGVHVFCLGELPEGRRKKDDDGIEMYESGRFIAMTGRHVPGTPEQLEDRAVELVDLHRRTFPPSTPRPEPHPVNRAAIIDDDAELLERMLAAANGSMISDLYHGHWQSRYQTQSSADLALCNALAFWTGRDSGRMDRIFRTSALMRPKWDRNARTGETYGTGTVRVAIEGCTQTYGSNRDADDGKGLRARAEFDDWLNRNRHWVRSTSFADFVPSDKQSATGYRTDSTDTKVADALLDIAESKRTRRFVTSLEDIRRLAGVGSRSTVKNALEDRLAGWFVTKEEDQDGRPFYVLTDPCRTLNSGSIPPPVDTMCSKYDTPPVNPTYSTEKGLDPWLTGRSRTAKNLGNELPGLGERILRIVDALDVGGSMTRTELAERTGIKRTGLNGATRRGELLDLFEVEQENSWSAKVYSLAEDWREIVAELLPEMTTFLLAAERADRGEEQRQRYAERRLQRGRLDPEKRKSLEHQQEKAIRRRRKLLQVIHPDWTGEEIMRWIREPVPLHLAWASKRLDLDDRVHDVRKAVGDLRCQDVPKGDWIRLLQWAGYSLPDIRLVLNNR